MKLGEMKKYITEHINRDLEDKKIFIVGNPKSGKSELSRFIYNQLLKSISSNKILLLAKNFEDIKRANNDINLSITSSIKTYSYISFVKQEITKYWPLLTKTLNINKNKILPKFADKNLSNYIMKDYINKFRTHDDYFKNLSLSNDNIAKIITLNMIQDINGDTKLKNISTFEKINDNFYDEYECIKNEYTDLLLSNGVLDDYLSILLYNKYLLKEDVYLNNLTKIEYLIIDDYNEYENLFYKLIQSLNLKGVYILSSIDTNVDFEKIYLEDETSDIKNLYGQMHKFLNDDNYAFKIKKDAVCVDRSSNLYIQMVDKITKTIENLKDMKVKDEDICIIVPAQNPYLEYELSKKFNINKVYMDMRLIKDECIKSLKTISYMYLQRKDYLKKEDYIRLYSRLLHIDVLSSNILFYKNEESLDLKNILQFINDCALKKYDLEDFLNDICTRYDFKEDIKACKLFIDELKHFKDILTDLNYLEPYMDFLSEVDNLKNYKSLIDIQEQDLGINMTTPYFLKKEFDIHIWCDITNNLWFKKNDYIINDKDLNDIICDTLKNMIYRCKKQIYIFQCEYSINGYEQKNGVSTLIQKISE